MKKLHSIVLVAVILVASLFAVQTPVHAQTNCVDWVNTHLETHLWSEDPTYILLDPQQVIEITTWCTMFGATIEDDSKVDKYYWLSDPHLHSFTLDGEYYNATASELGHQVFFDQWHAEGLI